MVTQYSTKTIEKKWQDRWEQERAGQASDESTKEKCYVLDMFPYPSGDGLHVGHVENYTATDIYARYKRLKGFEVMHPIGWDAFGLPAENFAIKTGVHPDEKTHQNIANFTRQIKSLGISYDWSREIDTSSPEYYRWTQWLFLFLYKNGLAYRKQASVNWCPSCQTVLANEQVIDGLCDRCKTEVIQKDLKQWFFKITDFIEDQEFEGNHVAGLLSGLEKIDWPESTKKAQQHWIGRSEGALVKFQIAGQEEHIEVFTTRVDTIFGCTYVVVAPEHALAKHPSIGNRAEVEKYLEETTKKTEIERTELSKDKTGVKLEGIEAINPFTNETVPVFVADYVLGNYGTGAVMAVPAHDERDFEFAKKYDLLVKHSVAPYIVLGGSCIPKTDKETTRKNVASAFVKHPTENTYIVLKWPNAHGGFVGGGIEEGEDASQAILREVREETGYLNFTITRVVIPHLYGHGYKPRKDVNCFDHDTVFLAQLSDLQQETVDESEGHELLWVEENKVGDVLTLEHHKVMWELYLQEKETFTEDGILVNSGDFSELTSEEAREKMIAWLEEKNLGAKKVNYRLRDWLVSRQRYWGAPIPIIYCETCGEQPVLEADLPVKLPTDVDFRPTGESPLTRSESFHDVKCPKCGEKARRESDTMDTFVCSSWYYLRFADPKNTEMFANPEKLAKWLPVDVYMGGAEHTVLHLLYARFFTKVLKKYGLTDFDEPFMKLKHQGMILAEDGRKMSKSLGNVVNPDDAVGQFGADTLRLYEMFMGPLEDSKAWKTDNLVGPRRFLEKVWRMAQKVSADESESDDVRTLLHKTIKKVGQDIEDFHFNTCISGLMGLANEMDKQKAICKRDFESLLLLLSPFAPHIAEELWESIGHVELVFSSAWPTYEEKFLREKSVAIVVQVNGKLRAKLSVPAGSEQKDVESLALTDEKVIAHTQGKTVRKIIFVPNRLLNIVI